MTVPASHFDISRHVAGRRPIRPGIRESESISTFTPLASSGLPLALVPRVLGALECAAVVLSAVVAKATYLDLFVGTVTPTETFVAIALAMAATVYVFFLNLGLYDVERIADQQLGLGKIIGGIVVSLLTVLGVLYSLKEISDLSRGWVFVWLAVTIVSVVLIRIFFARWVRRATTKGQLIRRIAIIGDVDFALSVASGVRQSEGLSGAIDLYFTKTSERDPRFVGGLDTLAEAMAIRPYDRVVVAIPGEDSETIRATVKTLGAFTTELLICDDREGLPVATQGTKQFGRVRADVVHLVPPSEDSALVKRAMDIVVAAIGLILLAPFLLIVAAAIKLDSPGSVFFRQRRLGQNSSVFWIYKFRSMTVEEDGPVVVQATKNDARVTRVGRFLRSTSLDELPQLINVLLGDMSLVGPRPHAIAHDTEFEKSFDLFSRRRRVKPGMTGWAQVNGYRGEAKTPEDVNRRMEHDLYYINTWSIWFDFEILVRTLFVLTRGAY